ncbi:PIG-L family deacetylase [Hahella ganghwensis]|uniref:PIG-L family deacetylase n=1 Tax=Hahella ganghwensis TaxID=286420 RepID=UPI00038020B2|nr:PIG-L family deacetylase [Hahella ganghwensis]
MAPNQTKQKQANHQASDNTSVLVVFRASCSEKIGSGHLRRCFTLARLMMDQGIQVSVVTDEQPCARLIAGLQNDIPVRFLSPDILLEDGAAIPSLLVIDAPLSQREVLQSPTAVRLMASLDRQGVSVVCLGHGAVNNYYVRAMIDLYPAQRVHSINYLAGPEYLIIRPHFREKKTESHSNALEKVDHLFVSMGGTDPFNLTRTTLRMLGDIRFRGQIQLLLGGAYSGNRVELEEEARLSALNVVFHGELDASEICSMMDQCQAGIVAFGTTAYEMMVLGKPVLCFTHYQWQESSALLFTELGAMSYLGCAQEMPDRQTLTAVAGTFLADSQQRKIMAEIGPEVVDGKGAERVTELLQSYAEEASLRQLDSLFVVAHPGDELFGCGGILLKQIKAGKKVGVVVLGEGTESRWSGEENEGEKLGAQQQIKSTLQKVMESLKVSVWYYYRFEDNRFDRHDLLDLVKVVERVIERHQPSAVYTHHPADLNIDHRRTYEATYTAARPTVESSVKALYSIEVPSSSDWGAGLGHGSFSPNWFEDVDEVLSEKLKLVEAYASEIRNDPHPRSKEAIEARARHWGRLAGLDAAEALVLQRWVACPGSS